MDIRTSHNTNGAQQLGILINKHIRIRIGSLELGPRHGEELDTKPRDTFTMRLLRV